ncbi:MAG: small multi-drug export protein [Treponema sp.]|jgi:uncharacterized membrane protein|nr:small multi-drug export protein [Treponema sp.]
MGIPLVLGWTALLAFLPISELRGAIPFAISQGIPWYWAYPFAVALNILVAPACWFFLATLHGFLLKLAGRRWFRWYRIFFDRFVDRAREKLRRGVERWGWLGVAAFVAVPLPVTGAWTGTLGAWVLGLNRRRTLAAVALGVIVAGAIVTLVVTLGIQVFSLFVKEI